MRHCVCVRSSNIPMGEPNGLLAGCKEEYTAATRHAAVSVGAAKADTHRAAFQLSSLPGAAKATSALEKRPSRCIRGRFIAFWQRGQRVQLSSDDGTAFCHLGDGTRAALRRRCNIASGLPFRELAPCQRLGVSSYVRVYQATVSFCSGRHRIRAR